MILSSPSKKTYSSCYWDNVPRPDGNLRKHKWQVLQLTRRSALKSTLQIWEYLKYTACSLPLMTNEEFIINSIGEELLKILFFHMELLLVILYSTLSVG